LERGWLASVVERNFILKSFLKKEGQVRFTLWAWKRRQRHPCIQHQNPRNFQSGKLYSPRLPYLFIIFSKRTFSLGFTFSAHAALLSSASQHHGQR